MSGLHWWARNTAPDAAGCGHSGGGAPHRGKAGATITTSSSSTSPSDNNTNNNNINNAASSTNFCGLSKLLKRMIKKRGSKMLKTAADRQTMSSQCRYDPLSYSLNFDTSGCGSLLDEDCHRLYAFSSRFAACSRADCQTPIPMPTY